MANGVVNLSELTTDVRCLRLAMTTASGYWLSIENGAGGAVIAHILL